MPGKELVELNPEMKAGVTPPDQKEYLLTVPAKKIRQAKQLARLCLQHAKLRKLEVLNLNKFGLMTSFVKHSL